MGMATFGAGCFWGIEAAFRKVDGVKDAVSGYAGGTQDNPTYEAVCTGATGHAEVVQVEFDPEKVSYEDLLEVFWNIHDPTTLNRQGPDLGTQYRSAIYYHSPDQETAARRSLAHKEESRAYRDPIVTEIAEYSKFYRAEEYHQRYIERHGH
jgi:peptide-methionine (S)-S-oxide reductase